MKTFVYLILTSLVSTFAGFGALGTKDPKACLICLAIAMGVWALFIWSCNNRSKKEADKRFRERMFQEFMRSKYK